MREPTIVLTPAKWEELQEYVDRFQRVLNLSHWRIVFSHKPADKGTLFQVVTTRPRNHAAIRVSPEGAVHPERARLLLHELLHLIVDPIREEHDFQMDALQTDRKQEYSARILREIEKVVEHLSYLL